jgi:hypothetical protein
MNASLSGTRDGDVRGAFGDTAFSSRSRRSESSIPLSTLDGKTAEQLSFGWSNAITSKAIGHCSIGNLAKA